MHKNQLQELAQRSCFNLPSYACIREGPDHAPRFKATVAFNGETFESPNFCSTLRQAEHAAAEVALNTLSKRGPTQSLAARILDETGVCKNLLQETAQRAGIRLPTYTTIRSGPGHLPLFTSSVEIAGMSFAGEPAKTKKQAEKNAAMAAWASLKQLVTQGGNSSQLSESESNEEQEQIIIARALVNAHKDDKSSIAYGTQTSQQTHHASSSQSQPRFARSTPSRIKITSFSGSSRQAHTAMQAPYCSSDWMSMDLNADPSSVQRHVPSQQQGHVVLKSGSPAYNSFIHQNQHLSTALAADASVFSREGAMTSRNAAHGSGNTVRPMPVRLHAMSVVPVIDRTTAHFTVEEHQGDEEEWFQRKNSTVVLSTRQCDYNSTDGSFPSVQPSYNPMLWAHHSQWLNVEPQHRIHPASTLFQVATNLAPPVRVRQMVAVCSTPPHPSESEGLRPPTTFAPSARVRQTASICSAPLCPSKSVDLQPAPNLAPPVRVRQMVPVCSSPAYLSECEDQERESKGEAATRQVLSQLRL